MLFMSRPGLKREQLLGDTLQVLLLPAVEDRSGLFMVAVEQGKQGHARLLGHLACCQLAPGQHGAEYCKIVLLATKVAEQVLLSHLPLLVPFSPVPGPFPVEGPLASPVQLQHVLPGSQCQADHSFSEAFCVASGFPVYEGESSFSARSCIHLG